MRSSLSSPRPETRPAAFAWVAAAAHCVGEYGAAVVGLFGIALLWAGLLYLLSVERQAAIAKAFDDVSNYARAFQLQSTGLVRSIDQTLLYARASYQRAPEQFDIGLWSQHGEFLTNPAYQVSIIDRHGQLKLSSFGPVTRPVDLSDRPHFRFQAESHADQMYISEPLVLRYVEKPAIQFTRRMVGGDGGFAGVVTVSVDPSYLTRFYASLDLGSDGVVALVGTDGIIRARAPTLGPMPGNRLASAPLMHMAAQTPNGSLNAVSLIDGVKRIYAYRAIDGYPLLAIVGMSERYALAGLNYSQRSLLALAGAATAALLIVIILIVRYQAWLYRAREAVRQSEARHAQKSRLLEVTLQNMDQGIIKMDSAQNVDVVNRRMAELWDLPESVAMGPHTQPAMLRLLWERGEFGHADTDFESWFDRFTREGGYGADGVPREHVRPDGRVLEIRGHSLPDGGAVQTFTDITARKQAEQRLRAARDEADRSARAKAEFLAMMSHEIRSPMSGLLGIIELLRNTPLAGDQLDMIDLVHGSAASLLRVVNDILDFSKMEAGRLAVNQEPVALRPFVAEIVEPTIVAATAKGLRFSSDVAEELPEWLVVDPLRLRQILINLLTNAVKFTSDGGVTLTVDRAVGPDGRTAICFAVADSGIGMSAEQLGRLFEPFSQADASTTKQFGGTGLGLTISRRLARLLGGDITVHSDAGRGSVFSLLLRLVPGAPKSAGGDEQAEMPMALHPRHILVAEDQPTNRWLIERQLRRLGCSVTTAEHGRAALVALDAGSFDLLITDCHMPEIDGIALTRMIRAAEAARGTARLPILGLTADVSSEMHARCLATGMNAVVAKPIDLHGLQQALTALTDPQTATPIVQAVAGDAVVFDPTACHELFNGNVVEERAWLLAYLDAAGRLVNELDQHAELPDREALAACAHKLSGASLAAGAAALGGLARRFEAASPATPESELHDFVRQIGAAWREATQAIENAITTPEAVA